MASQETMASPVVAGSSTPISKVIVAIHGIGNQIRSDTIRSVAKQFGDLYGVPIMPLGHFYTADASTIAISRLSSTSEKLAEIGFLEIYWADIARKVAASEDTLEETKAWGKSVVSRTENEYRKAVVKRELNANDFQLASGVVSDIVETIGVLENLLYILGKMGVFRFDLGKTLRDYVADVQVVTEFGSIRKEIVGRFSLEMKRLEETIIKQCAIAGTTIDANAKIYVVAHSEGTVIAFLALLEALENARKPKPAPEDAWIHRVRGLMTIGSPIDKHLLLWPTLFERHTAQPNPQPARLLKVPIKWHNYYDLGDPVGFKLDTEASFIESNGHSDFDFKSDEEHDHGFSRYWLPGKAHNDYWDDPEVFQHFIDSVILNDSGRSTKAPKDRWLVARASWMVPYLLSYAIHVLAVLVYYKVLVGSESGDLQWIRTVWVLGALLAGITVAARLPWLVKPRLEWVLLSGAIVVGCAGMVRWLLPDSVPAYIAQPIVARFASSEAANPHLGAWSLLIVCLLIVAISWLGLIWHSRHSRMLLIGQGAIVISIMIGNRSLGGGDTKLWPLLLAAMAFIYLWWLAVSLFDLAFIWQRYIRNSVAVDSVRHWREQKSDAKPLVSVAAAGEEARKLIRRAAAVAGRDRSKTPTP